MGRNLTDEFLEFVGIERDRQIEEEGFHYDHDDEYINNELEWASACYVAPESIFRLRSCSVFLSGVKDAWPWHIKWDKRNHHDKKKRIIISGALACAAYERIRRGEDFE